MLGFVLSADDAAVAPVVVLVSSRYESYRVTEWLRVLVNRVCILFYGSRIHAFKSLELCGMTSLSLSELYIVIFQLELRPDPVFDPVPTGHEGAVRGVASTGLVHQVLSAGADSQLKFWRLKTGQLLQSLTLDAPAARLVLHRER